MVRPAFVIPLYRPHIPRGAAEAIQQVLASGQLSGDGRLPELEARLQQFIGAAHLAVTAEFSRTIEMALRLAGVGPGDSVLLSPLACLATTMPLLQVGARPVWADIEPGTGCLDPQEIRRKHTSDVKAVLLYHWVGVPADIDGVLGVARELGLKVIEDAGESLGAEYASKRIGAHGFDYSVFSFSPARHITTGEGAAISCRDRDQDALARLYRRYGIPETGFRDAIGEISSSCDIAVSGTHNYMNRIAGALGTLQMDCLPQLIDRHRSNGRFFDERLAGVPGLRLLSRATGRVPSHWVYCFTCERRDDLRTVLRQAGIHASTVHLRNDRYTCFGAAATALPAVDEFERTQLCIPSGWWVTDADRELIAETIDRGW
jgi:dTDP-4-amino-4,6-dideoxygalactose transaminase